MPSKEMLFSRHALEQMHTRNISVDEVRKALDSGEVLTKYLDDKPFPSKLLLNYHKTKPIHVVYAENEKAQLIIITVYYPDPALWSSDFKIRRSS
jgi:Domain of unknown function (DUF4258)